MKKPKQSNVYLIEIKIPVSRMPLRLYKQKATLSHDKRLFYVSRGSAGMVSIGVENVTILACGIYYI